MNYPDQTKNPARQALNRAVNCAIAEGSAVFVNQPALPYVCEIVGVDGEIEICTNVASVSEAVIWLNENGISMEQIDTVPRVDYCIFRYQRITALAS
jgi:hypothetical protein